CTTLLDDYVYYFHFDYW
nr:immunoglobulin heavy chain junction region [Macaca mulatta]MOW33507.1 immunoglobulin heavy chain junction region [Macaca mulatta]